MFNRSNRCAWTCKRRMKSSQLRESLADQVISAIAHSRGKVMYSACLRLGIFSVHKLPCAPRMCACNDESKPAGTGSKEKTLFKGSGPAQFWAGGSLEKVGVW